MDGQAKRNFLSNAMVERKPCHIRSRLRSPSHSPNVIIQMFLLFLILIIESVGQVYFLMDTIQRQQVLCNHREIPSYKTPLRNL